MQKKNQDDSQKLKKKPFHADFLDDRLMTRREALATAGKAVGVAAGLAVLGVAGSAVAVSGRGGQAEAALATARASNGLDFAGSTIDPPSVGVYTYKIPSASRIDISHETVTLPLYKGRTKAGDDTWYIVTESSDLPNATQRGVNYSNKLLNALGTAAVQKGKFDDDTVVFEGTVNFGLTRVLVPDPVNGFPPLKYSPGAMGDALYSPLVHLPGDGKGIVLNAPQVANHTGVSGSVVDIDYDSRTVDMLMLLGFVDGQFSGYLRTDASIALVAAIERSTLAPNLNAAPGIANDEPPSSRAAIIPIVNGIRGDDMAMRQGLQSALLGQGDPFNVEQEQPNDPVHYSPIWDVTPVAWTNAAIAAGSRVQLHSQDDVRLEAEAGNVVSALPGTPNVGLGGINAIGAISNCPVIFTFPGRDYD
jgi:hypothetical protein